MSDKKPMNLPWTCVGVFIYDCNGKGVDTVRDEATAKHIVDAVNSHAAMVKALEREAQRPCSCWMLPAKFKCLSCDAAAAIALAKGGGK